MLRDDYERQQVLTCRSKVGWRSRKRALTALNRLRAHVDHSQGPVPIAVYKCPVCRDWHMTKRPR